MKQLSSLRSLRNKRAFTIIELLVAVAVTALMVGLMLTIVVNVLGGWNKSSGNLTSGNQARTVMDLITADLQSTIMRRDGNVWLVATVKTSPSWSGSSKPAAESLSIPTIASASNIEDYRFGQGGMWLRFFTTVPDTNESGKLEKLSAPRAVSYQIVRQSVVGTSDEKRYLFFRSELDPKTTFDTGYNLFDTANYYTAGTGSVIGTPPADTLIANNVIDFGVRFYKRDASNNSVLIFPDTADRCFAATSDSTKIGLGTDEGTPVRDFPVYAEIFVRILTDEGAAQIANLEEGLPSTGTWWEIALANSRVYTRRVEIKSTSL